MHGTRMLAAATRVSIAVPGKVYRSRLVHMLDLAYSCPTHGSVGRAAIEAEETPCACGWIRDQHFFFRQSYRPLLAESRWQHGACPLLVVAMSGASQSRSLLAPCGTSDAHGNPVSLGTSWVEHATIHFADTSVWTHLTV